jgi:tetratricopeptide (TPR) repeat protein
LWGQPSNQASALTDLDSLTVLCQQMTSNFGAWMVAQSVSRFMMFDEMSWGQFLIPHAKNIAENLVSYPLVAELLGITLFRLNYTLESFDLLEQALALHPNNNSMWNMLATLYSESHEDLAAIDVYQRAIEASAATAETYLEYGNLISLLDERQIELGSGNKHVSPVGRPFVDRYILTESDKTSNNMREAALAYQYAFEQDNTNFDALTHLVTSLVSLQDDAAWKYGQILVEHDKEGDVTASIIEQLSDEYIAPMIEILQKSLTGNPQQVNIRINLVRAYLMLGEVAKAKAELAIISKGNIPTQFQAVLSYLRLRADNDDFENRIGEIKDILQAKSKISANDAEFLEAIIEKEPSFSEGYRLLAETYLSWDEVEDALEVLLDCQSKAPFDPEATALLAKVLWDEGESNLALGYLHKGLEQDGQNATLLSLNSRFLFEDGQDEEAKVFLLRAEEIDPSNSELAATRLYIANTVTETKD